MSTHLFRERQPFPGQDPWIVPFEGDLLLIQSTAHNRKIVIRRFHDLDRMDDNSETVVWDPGRSDHGRDVWAPELHRLRGKWYVYYTASDGRLSNHRTYVLEADHPLGPYRELGKLCDPHHDMWSIDLTVLSHNGGLFAVWSGWEGERNDSPQNLYIAPMADPWTISGERRCISRPEHDWEMSVAPINEGPEVLRNRRRGMLFIVFSADASWTPAYKMGLLEWIGGDIMDPQSWAKLPRPIFNGGGHGCFVHTGGKDHAVYHRKLTPDPGWSDREIRSAPLSWNADGYPVIGRVEATTMERRAPHLRRNAAVARGPQPPSATTAYSFPGTQGAGDRRSAPRPHQRRR